MSGESSEACFIAHTGWAQGSKRMENPLWFFACVSLAHKRTWWCNYLRSTPGRLSERAHALISISLLTWIMRNFHPKWCGTKTLIFIPYYGYIFSATLFPSTPLPGVPWNSRIDLPEHINLSQTEKGQTAEYSAEHGKWKLKPRNCYSIRYQTR